MLIGHAHPNVVAAVTAQLSARDHLLPATEEAIRLAERICQLAPCAEQVRFTSTGNEAVSFALRLARAYRKRDTILKFEGGFHGVGDYAQYSVTPKGEPNYPHAHAESAGVPKVLDQTVLVAPFNDLETTGRIIAEHADELAAVIIEPLQRSIVPKPGFLQGVRQITRDHGIPMVLDEVVTGFRLAPGGAQEYYEVECDLAVVRQGGQRRLPAGGHRRPRRHHGALRPAPLEGAGLRPDQRHALRQPGRRDGRPRHAGRARRSPAPTIGSGPSATACATAWSRSGRRVGLPLQAPGEARSSSR